jgi:sarcosine oxidase delta subunit
MNWEHRKPDGVGDIEHTDDGFQTTVSIPSDPDGYFGRECPSCKALFKMRVDEYKALPDDQRLTCPYCGHSDDAGDFMTEAQIDRATEAMAGLAEQMVHDHLSHMLSQTFGRQRPSPPDAFMSIEMSYTPGSPPPVRDLPEVVEDKVRRAIECSSCSNHYAVFSATTFCPVCGPRPSAETTIEAIASARQALAIEDGLDPDEREQLRAIGVFERFAVDALGSVASLYEQFARDQFFSRSAEAAELVRGRGNVFQRLDDTAVLFAEHAELDLVALAGPERWDRLRRAFAQRHVLEHRGGIVDQRFLDQVADAGVALGQRLVIRRTDAESALDDLAWIVGAVRDSA